MEIRRRRQLDMSYTVKARTFKELSKRKTERQEYMCDSTVRWISEHRLLNLNGRFRNTRECVTIIALEIKKMFLYFEHNYCRNFLITNVWSDRLFCTVWRKCSANTACTEKCALVYHSCSLRLIGKNDSDTLEV